MTADWAALRARLSDIRSSGLALPLWWRDDDAVAPTGALDRLEGLSVKLSLPVHLAVIPEAAETALADRIRPGASFVPVVHGWRHANHAAPGEKKAEFGTFRPGFDAELLQAQERLRGLFGARLLPLFVPPWNRFDPACGSHLVAAGYKGLSTFGPRRVARPVPGHVQINTHVDPIDWRGSRDLVAPEILLGRVICLLEQRLAADADRGEPFGLLTHHLVHTPRVWDYSERLLSELLDGGAFPQPLAPLLEPPDEPS